MFRLLFGDFFPFFMLISLLFCLSGEALNPPYTSTHTHTLVKENKHARPAECVWLILFSVCGWEMSKWLHALSKFLLRPYAPLRSKSSSPCISSFAINTHNPCSGSQEACVCSTHVSFRVTQRSWSFIQNLHLFSANVTYCTYFLSNLLINLKG